MSLSVAVFYVTQWMAGAFMLIAFSAIVAAGWLIWWSTREWK